MATTHIMAHTQRTDFVDFKLRRYPNIIRNYMNYRLTVQKIKLGSCQYPDCCPLKKIFLKLY